MKLPNLFKVKEKKPRKDRKTKQLLQALVVSQRVSDVHIIALARLLFIKPSILIREVQNIKANAEYLLELSKEQQQLVKDKR